MVFTFQSTSANGRIYSQNQVQLSSTSKYNFAWQIISHLRVTWNTSNICQSFRQEELDRFQRGECKDHQVQVFDNSRRAMDEECDGLHALTLQYHYKYQVFSLSSHIILSMKKCIHFGSQRDKLSKDVWLIKYCIKFESFKCHRPILSVHYLKPKFCMGFD